ncbi:MAG: type III pantothenate kinase [Proteobacteria bacterium]|nr:type III pantothenate kinase [Pseudomonadota bacterium]NDC23964.1 type III pantothenate kinase [Pseudomonadota bacterium]NDD05167.1 type III pantothenate kinase [Pseudomonadota bacterium]NDG27793.1 type III pantothenate kinase [Pseudomonadota bacterium]
MLLVLDIGNTQTSFGVFRGKELLHHWRAETQISKTVDEYASFLFPLLNHVGLAGEKWEGVAICSVVPPVEETFSAFCRKYLQTDPFKVNSKSKLGFSLNVESPLEVGADRLANSAYAVNHLKLPAIVVDLGTATTFDVITRDKVYQGGIILPGVRMGAESLSKRTSLLPLIDVKFPKWAIGKSTITCIQSGVLFGYCDAIDGLLDRLEKEVGEPCQTALTGGLACLFHKQLKKQCYLLPDLTLNGAFILYELNR